jgi:ribonucleotide reductase alpha subunit
MSTQHEILSQERKSLQQQGLVPEWYSTQSWQMFKSRYMVSGEKGVKERFENIAKQLARHLPIKYRMEYTNLFFNLMWTGILSPSSPVLANTATDRGCSVSCSGQYIGDSVDSFYGNLHETAMLSKNSFGTSGYFGDIRPRGSDITGGGKATGLKPVVDDFFTCASKISHGGMRRGSFAAYVPVDHPDFDECISELSIDHKDKNYGWVITDEFASKLKSGEPEATRKWKEILKIKLLTGKGYLFFPDKANRHRPESYVSRGLDVNASNLCVVGDTLILTNKGEFPIKSLVNQQVNVWNGEEWSEVTIKQTGLNQEVTKVYLSEFVEGESPITVELVCTPYHKWYDINGNEYRTHELQSGLELLHWVNPKGKKVFHVVQYQTEHTNSDTYCFTEPKRHMGVFNGVLTGNCTEIMLHSSEEYSYSCILSSLNLLHWDKIKDSNAVFVATVFLDCLCSEFIEQAKGEKGLEKVVKFTEKGRAVGLGTMGFATYLQSKMIPYESLEAYFLNMEIWKHIHDESLRASQWLATILGEPEWCEGLGVRNTHRTASAPTKSTAGLMGGMSESTFPDPAMVFTAGSAAGELDRIPPQFLKLLKEKGKYTKEVIENIVANNGSVQQLDFLSDHEKLVFKNAFEIDQWVIFRMAKARQKYICQGQSLNFFIAENENTETLLSDLMSACVLDEDILSQYYIYTRSGVVISGECVACSA